jgi:hypothetical protein
MEVVITKCSRTPYKKSGPSVFHLGRFFIFYEEHETPCSEIRQGVKSIFLTCQRLFAQIRQVFFDRLHLQFQFAKIVFQCCDLFRFGLVTAPEMTTTAATFTALATTFSIFILAIAGMALVTFTLFLHISTSFQMLIESNS